MARSEDRFLVRASSDVTVEGEVYAVQAGDKVYGLAGADGKAEAARKQAEAQRQKNEAERKTAEAGRASADTERTEQQAKNNADQEANNAAAQGFTVELLGEGQYDPSTLVPTVDGAVGKFYLVPNSDPMAGDYVDYATWMYVSGKWTRMMGPRGSSVISIGADEPSFVMEGDAWIKRDADGSNESVRIYHESSLYPSDDLYPSEELYPREAGWNDVVTGGRQ